MPKHSADWRAALLALALAPVALAQGTGAGGEPTKAQPVLPREALTILSQDGTRHVFQVEVAKTPAEQTAGLMFRTALAPDQGMIFPWNPPQRSQMWMQNTLIPLDMLFIGAHGTIRHIAENTVPESQAVIDSRVPVAATLEVPAGTAARLDIVVGDKVEMAMFGTAK
ncbi:MAG: DUF192 domain-containing protein [Rhodospirillales bacterium]|nr:DUF192 domain-containing protein [Rhodospirillales bacterium]